MPKIKIDYSSTLFYMIFCKDTTIKDLYIGHTTNFVQRKHAHKQSCTNTKSTNYPCKLYTVIRDNGGWANWKMQIIAFHECDDFMAAKKYEQQYFEDYDATLNSIEPMPQPKPKIITEVVKEEKQVFHCNVCNMHFGTAKIYETHNKTKKHIKRTLNPEMDTITPPKISYKFYCKKCNYKCNKQSEFNKHLSTNKHNIPTNPTSNPIYIDTTCIYSCECGKIYKHAPTLYHHKKKCTIVQSDHNNELEVEQPINDNLFTQKMIETVLSQNKEVMNIFMDKLALNQNIFMEKMLEKLT
jgi:hypothetical protein